MIRLIIISLVFLDSVTNMLADGRCIPFFRNYPANEYNAHNRNFDVACDNYGNVFVANFEGLLYFDGATWRKVYTPGISRITRLAKGKDGRIWIGGYNIFGYLTADSQGRLKIKTIASDLDKNGIGEVDFIHIANNIDVHTIAGKTYRLQNGKLLLIKTSKSTLESASDSVSQLRLPSGCVISYSRKDGIHFSSITTKWGKSAWAPLSENDGLISNTVNYITYDKDHTVWGATDKGIFAIEAVSPYGHITEKQGLKGEVNCLSELDGHTYIGTMEGVYKINGSNITKVINAAVTCWQFDNYDDDKILCATTYGIYCITNSGVKQVNDAHTLSICMGHGSMEFFSGETDGIYHCNLSGMHKIVAPIEKVTKLYIEDDNLIAETIYGEIWEIALNTWKARIIRREADPNEPKVKTTDCFGTAWQTDYNGKNIELKTHSKYATTIRPWINPFRNISINALLVCKNGDIWFGGDFGIILLDTKQINDVVDLSNYRPYIREIVSLGDSVIWGGFGHNMKPVTEMKEINFPSSCHKVTISFSTRSTSFVQPTLYRYRIDGGRWTVWSEKNVAEINNMSYGYTQIDIQAQNIFGKVSEISTVKWYVEPPFYLKWYAILFYILFIVGAIVQFMRWRTKKLKREKDKLEKIVSERTSELSDALYDLKKTQGELVRMERTATAGKLTQGLIDRILNPINYINNFSKLTKNLAKDLTEDIEDEEENMSKDNFEDCEDILDMMSTNLSKIEEHGTNTTRTLRAMEAILNTRIGARTEHDIISLCRQTINVAKEYHAKEISECGIAISLVVEEEPVNANIDQEAFSKIIMSLLTNSIYAVAKKYRQNAYNPEITLTIKPYNIDSEHSAVIILRDNGIGIEDTIKEKVFDPFFTTKTTGEAAGVGLYLVRELIQDHKGTITLDSQKDEYCQFTITI